MAAKTAFCSALALTTASALWAAGDVSFNPQLSLGYLTTDNVDYVDGGQAADGGTSDQSVRLGLLLPVSRRMRNGSMGLTYDTAYTKFQDSEDLDHDGHRFRFSLSTAPDRISTLGFFVGFLRTQDQGNPEGTGDDPVDFLLSERTERDALDAGLAYTRQTSSGWSWRTSLAATRMWIKSISSDGPASTVNVEDRDVYGGDFAAGHALSRKVTLGGLYRYQAVNLEESSNQISQTVALSLERRLGKQSSIGFELGRFTRDLSGSATPEDEASFQDGGVYWSIDLNSGKSVRVGPVDFSFQTSIRPSSGGALRGASTDATVAVALSGARARYWNWRLATRYTRREPSDKRDPTLDVFSVGGFSERKITSVLGVRLTANYAEQSSDAAPTTSSSLDGSFLTLGIGLVWYPLGQTRIARS